MEYMIDAINSLSVVVAALGSIALYQRANAWLDGGAAVGEADRLREIAARAKRAADEAALWGGRRD